jgi:hypothetical protein
MKRFYAKFKKIPSGCWQWTAASNGYGRFNIEGKVEYAHRVSWYLHHGKWPMKFVCHTCDNPLCVNPAHLFEGTSKDNVHDALVKGRPFGAPLKHDPEIIRRLLRLGLRQREVASVVGCAQATVSEVNRGVR